MQILYKKITQWGLTLYANIIPENNTFGGNPKCKYIPENNIVGGNPECKYYTSNTLGGNPECKYYTRK